MAKTEPKQRLVKLNELLVTKLMTFDGRNDYPVFGNSISKDEQQQIGMNYMIYSTGDFTKAPDQDDDYTFNQAVYVTYVSENRGFLDGDILDIMSLIKSANHKVTNVTKENRQLENQDRYIDIAIFECSRLVKVGC